MSNTVNERKYYTLRLVSSEHQGRHRTYKQGDVFRSAYPLHEIFVNKFELLPNSPAPIEEGPDMMRSFYEAQAITRENPAAKKGSKQSASTNSDEFVGQQFDEFEELPPPQDFFDFASARNVSSQYSGAKEMGLSVYHLTGVGYAVAERGVKVPTNLAPGVLGSRKDVKEFLDSMKLPDMPD